MVTYEWDFFLVSELSHSSAFAALAPFRQKISIQHFRTKLIEVFHEITMQIIYFTHLYEGCAFVVYMFLTGFASSKESHRKSTSIIPAPLE